MSDYTPGPWTFSRWDESGTTRFYVAQADGAAYTPDYSDVSTLIAETVSIARVQIQEANARLIAAAPELLEACKAMIEWDAREQDHAVSFQERTELCRAAFDKARAAIAKATGKEAA